MDQVIAFPDPIHGEGDPRVVLVDDRDPSGLALPPQVLVTTRDELPETEVEEGLRFLEFLPAEDMPGKVGVRLRLSILLPGHGPAPLGEIVATFDDSDPLTAVDPTHVLAY
jgi:hypothetical protein